MAQIAMTEDEKTKFLAKLKFAKKYSGKIDKWSILSNTVVIGALQDFSRYEEGEAIKTSKIVKIHTLNNEKILETLNSYYYLLEEGEELDFHKTLATNLNGDEYE